MRRTLVAALIAFAIIPMHLHAQEDPGMVVTAEETDNTSAFLLLGLIGLVIASSQMGLLTTRDNTTMIAVPTDADGDLGFEAAE